MSTCRGQTCNDSSPVFKGLEIKRSKDPDLIRVLKSINCTMVSFGVLRTETFLFETIKKSNSFFIKKLF